MTITGAGTALLDCDPRFKFKGGSITSTSPTLPAVETGSAHCWDAKSNADPESKGEWAAYQELIANIAAHAGSRELVAKDFDQLKVKLAELRRPLNFSENYQRKLDEKFSDTETPLLAVADDRQKTLDLLSRLSVGAR